MIKIFYVYVIIITLSDAIAQSVIQYSYNNNNNKITYLSLFFYAIAAYFLFKSYKYNKIGIVNVYCGSAGILLILLIGRIFFNEKISHNEYIGIFLILIGIYLIEKKKIYT